MSMLDKLFDVMDYFFPPNKTKKKKRKKSKKQTHVSTNRRSASSIVETTMTYNVETDLQQVYNTQYVYDNYVYTGKEILTLVDKIDYSQEGQLSFINALHRSGHLKVATVIESKQELLLPLRSNEPDELHQKLQHYYTTLYKYRGEREYGKEIIKRHGMLERSYDKQVRVFEELLHQQTVVDISASFNGKLILDMSPLELSQLGNKVRAEIISKEYYKHYDVVKTGHEFFMECGKENNSDDNKLAVMAIQLSIGKLKPLNKELFHLLFPIEMEECLANEKRKAAKPVRSNTTRTTSNTTTKKVMTSTASSSKAKLKDNQHVTQAAKKDKVVPAATTQGQEDSFGKMLGSGIGVGAGLVLGGPFALAGEIIGSERLKNFGEKVLVSTASAGAIVGEATNGSVNTIVGVIADDSAAIERGKSQLTSASNHFVDGATMAIGNAMCNGLDVYEGIRDKDMGQLKEGAANLTETLLVGTVAVGVLDGATSIASDVDSSVASNHTSGTANIHTETVENEVSPGKHFVRPHEVSGHLRGDTYIEAYVRDGDGNTNIDRTVEEGGGYMRGNA